MTIICPVCDARFRDPPIEIKRCRPMQCSKCEHEWVADVPRITMDAPSLAPELADLSDDETIKTSLPVVIENEVETDDSIVDLHEPVFVDRLAPEQKNASIRILPPILGLALFATVAASVVFKSAIVAEVPTTKPYYQALGLISTNPNLSIANVVTTKSKKDGISRLIVKGEIQNIADNTVPVPPLKITMRGNKNANLYAWTVSATKDTLGSGETSRFTAVAHDIPGEAVNVEVEFLPQKVKLGEQ